MYNSGEYTHAKIALPKPQVHANHPFKHTKNHERLLEYLRARLLVGKDARDQEIARLAQIDKDVAGWMRLSDEDKERKAEHEQNGSNKVTQISLPLNYVHLDDMMTYFASTFAPNRGMFYQAGKPDEQKASSQIVTLMNNHAIYAGYYREVLLGVFSLLKYNVGGFKVAWSKEEGPKLSKENDKDKVEIQLRWQGNKLEALDNYNLLYDRQVHPTRLHIDGEFAALVKMRSHYWLQAKAAAGAYYNCESILRDGVEGGGDSGSCTFYRSPPREAKMDINDSRSGTDWVSVLSENSYYTNKQGFELTEIYIRLNPTEFGLIQGNQAEQAARSRYEVWRFTVLNNMSIIEATHMNNVHGYLPIFMGVLNDDLLATSQKSIAEILQPLQSFASFLLNTHVAATRKNIWGLTVYDPSMVDMSSIEDGEVAARVPMNPGAQGRDVRTGIWQPTGGVLDTQQTMRDLDSVMGIIGQFFPTQALPSQIANMDRAVTSQVAAVQHGANRRQQKAARLLDESVFRNVRFAMYYNIIQYQPDESEVTDLYTGRAVKVDLAQLRNTDLPFIIGQGLKAIDRQSVADKLQQIIFALIQAPKAAEGIDLLGIIDYWTSMIDVDIDMNQFKVQAPPEGQEGAPQVDAGGNPIQPATNPAAVSAPIYG